MKNPKKPTVAQRKLMQAYKLDSRDWFIVKDTPEAMTIVHRFSDSTVKELPKG